MCGQVGPAVGRRGARCGSPVPAPAGLGPAAAAGGSAQRSRPRQALGWGGVAAAPCRQRCATRTARQSRAPRPPRRSSAAGAGWEGVCRVPGRVRGSPGLLRERQPPPAGCRQAGGLPTAGRRPPNRRAHPAHEVAAGVVLHKVAQPAVGALLLVLEAQVDVEVAHPGRWPSGRCAAAAAPPPGAPPLGRAAGGAAHACAAPACPAARPGGRRGGHSRSNERGRELARWRGPWSWERGSRGAVGVAQKKALHCKSSRTRGRPPFAPCTHQCIPASLQAPQGRLIGRPIEPVPIPNAPALQPSRRSAQPTRVAVQQQKPSPPSARWEAVRWCAGRPAPLHAGPEHCRRRPTAAAAAACRRLLRQAPLGAGGSDGLCTGAGG